MRDSYGGDAENSAVGSERTRRQRGALLRSSALAVIAALTPAVMMSSAARADGGSASSSNIAGGTDSAIGTGGTGGGGVVSFGGGGGGAGATGGTGGASPGGTGGSGGATAGASGTAGSNGNGGSGGGGGAHGTVSATLPGTGATGGNGGAGGTGTAAGRDGGGGGAGGYGAVVTGNGALGTLTVNLTGGNGGAGGSSPALGGSGGTGGIGLLLTDTTAKSLTISSTVTGGTGGAAGAGAASNPGAGGAGVVGQNLTLILGGTGTIAGGASGGGGQANAVTFTGGSNVFQLQAGGTVSGNVVGVAAGTDKFQLGGATDSTFNTALIGAGATYRNFASFEKTGTSTWTLTGTTTATTAWQINQGALSIASDTNLGAAAGTLGLNGGTLQTSADVTSARAVTLGTAGGTFDNGGNNLTLSGAIANGSGAGALTATGGGTTTLTGTLSYTGLTTVQGGSLVLGDATRAATLPDNASVTGGSLAVANGSLGAGTINNSLGRAIVVGLTPGLAATAGSAIIISNGTVAFQNSGTAGTAQIDSTGLIDFADTSHAGSATITSSGGGLLQFRNASSARNATITTNTGSFTTFAGGSTADNATLTTNTGATLDGTGTIFVGGASGGTSRQIVNSGGLLDIAGIAAAGTTIGSLEGSGGLVAIGNKMLTIGLNNASTVFAGTIQNDSLSGPGGTGGIDKTGSGTLTLTGANTYAGTTTISGGMLQIGNGGTTGSLGPASVINNAALAFNRSDSVTVANAISGTGAVLQAGSGTTVLTGANSYAGTTTIAAGTLQVGNGGTTGSLGTGSVVDNGTLAFNRSDTITVANAISGTGALSQSGNGATVLTGANSYAGPTTISNGILQIGDGGTSGALGSGNVSNNSALLFRRSDTITVANAIAGSGALTQGGTGNLVLTGASTYTGATSVASGTLSVNGSIVSAVTVAPGATLGGSGAVGPTTINAGGTLAPGNSIGTITINGNLVLGAGAIYKVEVSPTAADRTNVSGSATLTGAALQATLGAGTYASRSYTILSAAGGLGGTTFASFNTTALPAGFKASVSYTPTDVLLNLTGSLATTNLPPNAQNVANALNTIFNAGGTVPGGIAVFSLTGAPLSAALNALSGEVHVSAASALQEESLYVRAAILGRLRQGGYGSMAQMAALQVGGPQAFAGREQIAPALAYATEAKSPLVTKAPALPAATPDLVYWGQGFGASGRLDSDGNAATLRRDSSGFITGIDTRIGSTARAGIAAGYTASQNRGDGIGTADIESGHIAAYAGAGIGNISLRAGGAYAFHTIATDRTIAFAGLVDRATANYGGGTAQIFGEAGYAIALANLALEPFAGGAFVHVNTNGVSERALSTGLNFAGTTLDVGYSSLGLRFASLLPLPSGMVLMPRASVAWQHAFGAVAPQAAFAFQSAAGTSFTLAGVPLARDALYAEAGVDLALNAHASIGISYTGQIASNARDNAGKGRFSWKF
jgi:autotransporter-associated beta strand protein